VAIPSVFLSLLVLASLLVLLFLWLWLPRWRRAAKVEADARGLVVDDVDD
jgi:hypothetical protein